MAEAGYALAARHDFVTYQYLLVFAPRPSGPVVP